MEYVRLKGLVELKQGMAINAKSNHLVVDYETSLPLLRIADMPTKRKVVFMDENTPERFWASEEDIIYTRTGQVGLVFRKQKGVVHNNCFRVIPNDETILDRNFLYWALSLKSVYNYANGIAAGAAQPDLPHNSFKTISIPLFDLGTQKKIVDILDGYEELIENNTKRIKLLEHMAENLYKEWFVRFRFPGHEEVEFENGLPKGWEVKRLYEVANVQMGQSPESIYYNDNGVGLPFHQGVGSYGDWYLEDGTYSTEGKRIAEPYSIIFSVRAPVGRININLNRVILGRGVASINAKDGNNAFLLWLLKYMFSKEDIIGNGSIFTSVTKDELLGQKLVIPDSKIVATFNQYASDIEKQIRTIYLANKNLIKQRDLLLPRLMSGKLEVKQT